MAKADLKIRLNIRESAEGFLRLVEKKFKLTLDFSEESLLIADDLITIFFKVRKSHYYRAAGFIGSYLGEVIIENMGGRWQKDLTLEKVGNMKGFAHPMIRAKKRLANGMQDSLSIYYRSLKLSTCQDTSFAMRNGVTREAYAALRTEGWDREVLSRVLDDEEKSYVREEASDLLGRLAGPAMVPRLVEGLKDNKSAYFCAKALQGLPDGSAFKPLMELMKKTRSPIVKMQAALALGAIGNPEALDELIKLLDDENEILAHYASMAVGKIGGAKAVEMLLEIMASHRPGKRVYAIAALEEIGDRKSVPALIEALFSRDEEIKESAVRALQYIPDERAFKPLLFLLKDKSYRIRTLTGYALANFEDSRALPYIKMLLRDEVQAVRHHAAKLIYWLEKGEKPARCI
ncbi:MAG: HEAT repeat domain-containing protein [Candidatus Eremiobacteraeota bacterium]|nr:HEAT repeat domain-containing protein [Candidatus Eremiobacteraeota bacterium]